MATDSRWVLPVSTVADESNAVSNVHAGVSFRPAVAADLDGLFAGYERTVGPYVRRIWGWDRRFQRQRFRDRYALANFRVIELEGRFAGAIHVERRAAEIYLALLYLLPEFQKRGIGGALVRELLEEGRARGMPVALTVIDGNPARELYEQLGFATVARDNHSSRMVWSATIADGRVGLGVVRRNGGHSAA